MKKVHK